MGGQDGEVGDIVRGGTLTDANGDGVKHDNERRPQNVTHVVQLGALKLVERVVLLGAVPASVATRLVVLCHTHVLTPVLTSCSALIIWGKLRAMLGNVAW